MKILKKNKNIKIISIIIGILILISSIFYRNNYIVNNKQIIKEMDANTQVSSLNSTINELNKTHEEYQTYVQNSKANIAQAITTAGIQTDNTATFETITANISKIKSENSSVYYKTLSNGNTVPIPRGFYYVGGTINSGVVISDEPSDNEKYAGYEDVPDGVVYNSDGTVNETSSTLKGNQFVWIPVSASNYVKKTWGKNANGNNSWNATWETQTNTAELLQIQKYGGFYVGRYEAGTSNITLSTGVNFANKNTASGWVNDSFSIRDGLGNSVSGKIRTKAGEIPYYHADYFTALKLSNSMYQTDYVQSGLVTGTMWDAMMKFIAGNDDTIVTKSAWGNYTNGSVTHTAGKGRYATVDNGSGAMTSAFTKSDGAYHYGIKTTAVSENVKKKNMYDLAGNLWEWTQEAAYPNNTIESYMLRGGGFHNSYSDGPVCYRDYSAATGTGTHYGFRPALYIR